MPAQDENREPNTPLEKEPEDQYSNNDEDEQEETDWNENPSRFNTVMVLGIAFAVSTVIAIGAIGYIIGTSTNQTVLAPQPVVQPNQPQTLQQLYPPAEQTSQIPSRPAAYDFAATTMEGQNFEIEDNLGTPTLLVFWSHW